MRRISVLTIAYPLHSQRQICDRSGMTCAFFWEKMYSRLTTLWLRHVYVLFLKVNFTVLTVKDKEIKELNFLGVAGLHTFCIPL